MSESAVIDSSPESRVSRLAAPESAGSSDPTYSRAVYACAVALTLAVFPLIWVGGLVTTYDAGMAVPDWPGTYGWNMFAYPASTWLFGPFDLLVEHGHRLLGALAGFISIGLVVAAFAFDTRRWFRCWTIGVLVAVIIQGALGGARVVLDQRTIAMIHGCTGPLFFAIATATAVMSSRWWMGLRSWGASVANSNRPTEVPLAGRVRRFDGEEDSHFSIQGRWVSWLATALVVASYLQLIMGAQLRHVTGSISHGVFMGFVHTHLTLAAVVTLLAVVSLVGIFGTRGLSGKVRVPLIVLSGIVVLQLLLGFGTWVVNYASPWPELNETLAAYTIAAKGFGESLIVTAHMATGSLIVSLATVASLRAWRWRRLALAPNEVN